MTERQPNNRNTEADRKWFMQLADAEEACGSIAVGGLAVKLGLLTTPASFQPTIVSFAKFIELSRRRLQLTVEQLAEKAQVDLAELVAIDSGNALPPEPRTVFQLAQVLKVEPGPLLELAGLAVSRDSRISDAAIRFAARSESTESLTPDEEEALNWFVNELAKK